MERQIPHVLDVFSASPGVRRRHREHIIKQDKEDMQKNPGSDSAVSVGSSDDDESEEQRHISRYFEYLNEDELLGSGGGSSQRRKKKKKTSIGSRDKSVGVNNEKNKQQESSEGGDRQSRRGEFEKEGIRHIERHLSMKKTIRKKMMRDLQQAFVEDPKDFHQDPKALPQEKKSNIDINNLTISKNRISKSEHNFLDMLKDDQVKEKKGFKALIDFRKDKSSSQPSSKQVVTNNNNKTNNNVESKKQQQPVAKNNSQLKSAKEIATEVKDTKTSRQSVQEQECQVIRDDDSGHGSPSREPTRRSKSRDDLLLDCSEKDTKKTGFWKRITGKNKTKR